MNRYNTQFKLLTLNQFQHHLYYMHKHSYNIIIIYIFTYHNNIYFVHIINSCILLFRDCDDAFKLKSDLALESG